MDSSALFTTTSLLSLQGAAAAALLVPNVLGYLIGTRFDPARKWVSFSVSMVLAYAVAIAATEADGMKWLIAFFNGFLIFAAAVGINQASAAGSPEDGEELAQEGAGGGARGPRFFAGWFGRTASSVDDAVIDDREVPPPS